ncbi:MAG: metallopeptidase TldD-related protein [Pseudomonadota bacterium]
MRRALLLLLALSSAARADTSSDVLLDSLATWAVRARDDLALSGGPPPARTVFAAVDLQSYQARAELGAMVSEAAEHRRPGRVEVVVGSDALDSSRFQMRERGFSVLAQPALVVEDVPLAIERDLWLTADHAYKAAVVQAQVKQAALSTLGGEAPPDWSAAPAAEAVDLGPIPAVDDDLLRRIALEGSAALRGVEGLRSGRVEVHAWSGRYYLATSEGTRLVQPEGYAVIFAHADLLRPDGVVVEDARQWVTRTSGDLPPLEELVASIAAMGRGVQARAAAPVVDYYEGPVLFEGEAAADLFRYLAAPELCGTPPEPSPVQTYQQLVRAGPRLGRRLLPAGWSVVDDPGRDVPGLAGGTAYDREGVAMERVELVRDGAVRDLLMTRVPRLELQRSNGHARGSVQGDWEAAPTLWEVNPPRNLSDRAFERELGRTFGASGQERMLVVRALGLGRAGSLPRPTDAVWRDADGHEEPVASLQFQRVDRRLLRDIVAAGGGEQHRAYLAPWTQLSSSDGDSGLPTVLTAPRRVLIAELEAVFPGADEKPTAYPMPALE